jgi:DNA mismatch repair protein MutH
MFSQIGIPLETTPHINAHIGGNHVIGFNNSSVAEKLGTLLEEVG